MREKYLRAASVVKSDVDLDTWRAFELTVVNGEPCEEVANLLGNQWHVYLAVASCTGFVNKYNVCRRAVYERQN